MRSSGRWSWRSNRTRLQQDLISAMVEGEDVNNEVAKLKRILGEKGAKIDSLEKELKSLKNAKS